MYVKVVLKDRKEGRIVSTSMFDTVSEANRYIRSLLADSLLEPSLKKYEVIITHEEAKEE